MDVWMLQKNGSPNSSENLCLLSCFFFFYAPMRPDNSVVLILTNLSGACGINNRSSSCVCAAHRELTCREPITPLHCPSARIHGRGSFLHHGVLQAGDDDPICPRADRGDCSNIITSVRNWHGGQLKAFRGQAGVAVLLLLLTTVTHQGVQGDAVLAMAAGVAGGGNGGGGGCFTSSLLLSKGRGGGVTSPPQGGGSGQVVQVGGQAQLGQVVVQIWRRWQGQLVVVVACGNSGIIAVAGGQTGLVVVGQQQPGLVLVLGRPLIAAALHGR